MTSSVDCVILVNGHGSWCITVLWWVLTRHLDSMHVHACVGLLCLLLLGWGLGGGAVSHWRKFGRHFRSVIWKWICSISILNKYVKTWRFIFLSALPVVIWILNKSHEAEPSWAKIWRKKSRLFKVHSQFAMFVLFHYCVVIIIRLNVSGCSGTLVCFSFS